MIVFIVVNHLTNDLIAKHNPQYSHNEFVNPNSNNDQQIPEFTNVSNPNSMMQDSNYYYQQTEIANNNNNNNLNTNKTSFPIMSPHGVPSSNQSWNKQFQNKNHY